MQEIVRKYSDPESPYMLPIIKESGKDERRQYLNASHLKHIPLPVISEALGHDSEDTTRIYLALLDTAVVDSKQQGHQFHCTTEKPDCPA